MKNEDYNSFVPMMKRVENFKLFYQRENTEILFGFFYGSDYPLHRYKAAKNLPEDRPLKPEDFNVEDYLDDCERLFEIHEACGGDFIWSASAFWGIPWLEAALGCPIYADHATGSIRSEIPDDFSKTLSIPTFDMESPWIKKTGEFLEAMAERSKGRWPIGTTRMRGISDLLSALYGVENFIYAMLENPETVQEICNKLTDFWIAYGHYQLNKIPLFCGGVGSFYYNMWAPEGTVWLQEDATALLSPALYDEFIRPCNERIVNAFQGCIIHQHSSGYAPTDAYINMGIIALEVHIDEGGPRAKDLYDLHKKIMEHKPLLIWGNLQEEDLDWIFNRLPANGLAVMTTVSSPEEARRLWDKYKAPK